jgi:hypothetical protein
MFRFRTIAATALALSAAGLGMVTAASPTLAAAASKPKVHYIGSCRASGSFPICSISSRTAFNPARIKIHVFGRVRVNGGRGRIEADWDNSCFVNSGSSADGGGDPKFFPPYIAHVRVNPGRASQCSVAVTISPANDSSTGGYVKAYISYTKRNGR